MHFYYDSIPSYQFLKAKFSVENNIPTISFYLEFDEENEINNVIRNHFEKLSLIEQYKKSYNEILDEIYHLAIEHINNGCTFDDFKDALVLGTNAKKKTYGVNFYKTVIYTAICENIDDLKKWIYQRT